MIRLLLVSLLLWGCQKETKAPALADAPPADALVRTSEVGPVKATVTLSPQKPRLGDSLTLTLTVHAQPEISVEMPPFGDALGRFAIKNYTPRTQTNSDGSSTHSQRYSLEVPMSGRQRIPAMRIEFTDRRASTKIDADGGGDSVHELLTDEISIEIASVLPENDKNYELRGLRGPLDESLRTTQLYRLAAVLGLVALCGVAIGLVLHLRRRARLQVRISAYDVAMQRLFKLQSRGFPAAQDVDRFYVELSDIVRRYIEDRYGVRAPELTTEEFLREARQQLRLAQAQRDLLEAFLSTCDRVKFAGYRPIESESRQVLEEARRFLQDTRLSATPQPQEARP